MATDPRFSPVVVWSPIVQGLINNMTHKQRELIRNGTPDGAISVHPDLCKSVRGHATPADREQTRAVLELMGGKTSDVCNLENADAISCVMHVFFRALGSQERSRGLFVVWNSIRELTRWCADPLRENNKAAIAAKNHIGQVYFGRLVEMMGFPNGRNHRMAAEILLELLRKCPGQLTILASQTSKDLRVLGKMVLTGSDHLRAFIYGSIIREMIPYNMGFSFWPEDASKKDIDRFPKTVILNSDWVEKFVQLRRRKDAPGRDRIMLVGAVEIENETWVTQCGIPVVMAFSEYNPSCQQEIVLVTFQAWEVAYLRIPNKNIADVRLLEDDNRAELVFKENGYYTSRHEHRKKKVKAIRLAPHSSATAKDVVEGVRLGMAHRPGHNNYNDVTPAGPPAPSRTRGALDFITSNIFGRNRKAKPKVLKNRRFGYDGSCDDDDVPASNAAGQTQNCPTRGYASAIMELPTIEQVEIENANFFVFSQEPRIEVPDSQTQGTTRAAPSDQALSDASSASSEVVPETISQVHVESAIHPEDMELDLEIGINTNENGKSSDNESVDDAPTAESCVAKYKGRAKSSTPELERDEEPQALEKQQGDARSESEENQKGADRGVEVPQAPNPDKSTRLRRPSRKILRPPPRKTGSVDWSQDIRVDPEEQRDNVLSKLPKAKKPAFRQLRDVKVSSLKAHAKKKKATIPSDKSRREVLKTIASTRVRRAAAEKAKEKLALAVSSEDESVAFDPEDPIETSSAAKLDTHVNPIEDTDIPECNASNSEDVGEEYVPVENATANDDECNSNAEKSSVVAKPESDDRHSDVVDSGTKHSNDMGEENGLSTDDNEADSESNKQPDSEDDIPRIATPSIADSGVFIDEKGVASADDEDEQVGQSTVSDDDHHYHDNKKSILSEDDQSEINDVDGSTTYAYTRSTPMRTSSPSEPETPCPKGRKRTSSACEAPELRAAKKSPSMAWKNALRESQKTTLDILMDTSHRLVNSMVNEERTIEMVVLTYKNGLERVKQQMLEAHEGNLAYARGILEETKTGLAAECRDILDSLGDKVNLGPFHDSTAHADDVLEEIKAAMEGYKGM